MPNYLRNRIPVGSYFFTVNLLERYQNTFLIDEIDLLHSSFHTLVKAQVYPPDWTGCATKLDIGKRE